MSSTTPLRATRIASQLSHLSTRTSTRAIQPRRHLPRPAAMPIPLPLRPRAFSTTRPHAISPPPKSKDRGPKSSETTQTDFGTLDVLGSTPAPTTGIDATTTDGFALNSGLRVTGSGVLLVGGDVFRWRPWVREGRVEGTVGEGGLGNDTSRAPGGGAAGSVSGLGTGSLRNERGMWEVDRSAWGVLETVWPKPDLLIIGTGPTIVPISPATRKHINELGIRLEVSDTRNAAAQFNLLATERGVQQVAAALVPIGWKDGK